MKSERGFSLVELMVALAVGLIIVLGAGQLLLSVFKTHRQVETLSEKQAAVNFAVDTLMRDIRRACWEETEPADGEGESDSLTLSLPDGDGCASGMLAATYSLGEQAGGEAGRYSLKVDHDDGAGAQEVVSGLAGNGFRVAPEGDYGMKVTLELIPTAQGGEPDSLTFVAINRTQAVSSAAPGAPSDAEDSGDSGDSGEEPVSMPDEGNPGFYQDGTRMYDDSCYNGANKYKPNQCDG